MKKYMQYGFVTFWIIMSAVCFYLTKDWNSQTALFPRVISLPMLVISIVILAVEIVKGRRQDTNLEADDAAEFKTFTLRMAKYFAWLIGFAVLIWAIGIVYAIPIYIFCYMKIEGNYGWLKCGLYAMATTVFISLLFDYIFHVGWPEGALLRILNL